MLDFLRNLFGYHSHVQSTKQETELERFYTDSEQELQIFEQLVGATSLNKYLLLLHGLSGVGKSTLLKMYILFCQRHNISAALVASEEVLSPVNVLADWAADLSSSGTLLPGFQKTLKQYRTVQSKVEAEANKSRQDISHLAGTLGMSATKAAISMAASTIPIAGPVLGAVGGEGAEALVNWLHGILSKPDLDLYLDSTGQLTAAFLNDLTTIASHKRVVLMIDTYEQMTALDTWMRDLAQSLPRNVLLVIASRRVPDWNRGWQEWMGKATILEMKEMTPDDLRKLVNRYYSYIKGGHPSPKQVDSIVQFARGLPIVATTVVQLWVKYGVEDFQMVRPQVIADLVDRLFEGVPFQMRPTFEAAAALRYFNSDTLRALLEVDNADLLYAELSRWPFIRPRREGQSIHDTIREMINEALYVQAPERFQLFHQRAVGYYEAQVMQATGDNRERFALELLYHQVLVNEDEGIKYFSKTAEELVRYQLCNQLSILLNDVNNYPLKKENNHLWRDYYKARLMDLEGHTSDAVELYQKIAGSEMAEEKLRAYALCDWAHIARLTSLESMGAVLAKLRALYPRPELQAEPDAKLGSYLLELSDLFRRQGRWSEALENLERARKLYEKIGDVYGQVNTINLLEHYYLDRGMWNEGFRMQQHGLQEVTKLSGEQEQSYLKAQFLGSYAINWMWAGQYHQTEERLREALSLAERFGRIRHRMYFLRDLALVLGLQGKMQESVQRFAEAMELEIEKEAPVHSALIKGFQGLVALKRVGIEEAEHYLTSGMDILREVKRKELFMPSFLNWLGILYEMKGSLDLAEQFYQETLDRRQFEQRYRYSEALTGLVRVYYLGGNYSLVEHALSEAESLAKLYEYNDHLASLRLIQGHIVWNSQINSWGQGFDRALVYYQQALIHALRYNRFLLDEVLSGSPYGTPFEPIIPYSLRNHKEGKKMLLALQEWWHSATNDIDSSEEIKVSLLPQGSSLIECEQLARDWEPGDGSFQKTVIRQLEQGFRNAS